MVEFAAGIIFFNEVNGLKRCLDSLKDFDRVYCIDGKFKGYGHMQTPSISSDGSRQLVMHSYSNTVLVDKADVTEIEKRNTFLDMAAKDGAKYLLYIDADEWLTCIDWDLFKEECHKLTKPSIYRILFYDGGINCFTSMPRLIYQPEHFEYYLTHDALRYKPANYIANAGRFSAYVVRGFRMIASDDGRPPAHIDNIKAYQETLSKTEFIEGFKVELEDINRGECEECTVATRRPVTVTSNPEEVILRDSFDFSTGQAIRTVKKMSNSEIVRRPLEPGE